MKKIMLIFSLLVCFILTPAAFADSETSSPELIAGINLSTEMTQMDLAATTIHNMLQQVAAGNGNFNSEVYDSCRQKIDTLAETMLLDIRRSDDMGYAYAFAALGNLDFVNFTAYSDAMLRDVQNNNEESFKIDSDWAGRFYDSGMSQYDNANDYLTYIGVFDEPEE